MEYKQMFLLFILLSGFPLETVEPMDELYGDKRPGAKGVSFLQSLEMPAEKKNTKVFSEAKKGDVSSKDEKSKSKPKSTQRKQAGKSTPPKNFVPSEKIRVDKAVDFPVGI
jgi:hypothetical protein